MPLPTASHLNMARSRTSVANQAIDRSVCLEGPSQLLGSMARTVYQVVTESSAPPREERRSARMIRKPVQNTL